MRRTIWHLARATLMFGWLYQGYVSYKAISPILFILLFAGFYDLVLAYMSIRKRSVSIDTQRIFSLLLFSVVLILISLEKQPWDAVFEYLPLWLYFFEAVFSLKSKKAKLVLLPSVVVISAVVVFFSLYGVCRMSPCTSAYINNQYVSGQIIRLSRSGDIIVVADNSWFLVSHDKQKLEGIMSYRSILFKNFAFVDVRSSARGIVISKDNPKVGYDPKLLYQNSELSFYINPNKMFVCKGVEF